MQFQYGIFMVVISQHEKPQANAPRLGSRSEPALDRRDCFAQPVLGPRESAGLGCRHCEFPTGLRPTCLDETGLPSSRGAVRRRGDLDLAGSRLLRCARN